MNSNHSLRFCFLVFLLDGANLEMINTENTPCKKSSVNYNVTLSKGAKAGKYYKIAGTNKMDECIGHCCGSKRCDVAFMVNKNCYLVKCHNSDSCVLKQSDNPKFDTMLAVVSKSKEKAVEGKFLLSGWIILWWVLSPIILFRQFSR